MDERPQGKPMVVGHIGKLGKHPERMVSHFCTVAKKLYEYPSEFAWSYEISQEKQWHELATEGVKGYGLAN